MESSVSMGGANVSCQLTMQTKTYYMKTIRFIFSSCFILFVSIGISQAQQLEIHFINVGWGGSMFIKGPNGTTLLIEAGNTGKGATKVVPYLKSIGIQPADGFDYTIAGHQHSDHLGGLDEVINAGYNVRVKNYYNGSTYSGTAITDWNNAAATTTAGAPVIMPVGAIIDLGDSAKVICIARNGNIIGGGSVAVSDENDRSIALLIQYQGFDFLWGSDLGGGSDNQSCTGRSTSQVDVETSVITAISPGGASPLIPAGGIDVLFVNHHGSESSTNKNWMNLAAPAVAVINTGAGQTTGWDLPRKNVVENVLLAQASCISVPPAIVLQTEEGAPVGSKLSTAGFCVGDIKISVDGKGYYVVSADGAVTQGPNEVIAAALPRTFITDDHPPGHKFTNVVSESALRPDGLELEQNFPNPFNPSTTIVYTLAQNEFVTLEIFDMLGRRIRKLVSQTEPAGVHSTQWNGKDDLGIAMSGGVYLYRGTFGNRVVSKMMVLLK
jgi:beta-lactamase superfamily II metal-dependent hydrolase